MFILPLAVGIAGLWSAAPEMIRRDTALAYCCMFAASVFAAVVGAGGLLQVIRPPRKIMQLTPQAHADGFREVLSSKSIAERCRASLVLLTTAVVLDVTLAIKLLVFRGPPYGDELMVILLLSVPVAVFAIQWRRLWLLRTTLAQPRLFIQPFPINRGTPLQIRLESGAIRPLDRLHASAWLICIETNVFYLRRANLAVPKSVVEYIAAHREQSKLAAGDPFTASARVNLSTGTPASGSATVDGFPNYQWFIHLELSGSIKFIADFPLEIG